MDNYERITDAQDVKTKLETLYSDTTEIETLTRGCAPEYIFQLFEMMRGNDYEEKLDHRPWELYALMTPSFSVLDITFPDT